ncbi:MAG: site-2 protease family protein [Anaerolineae bacterium]|nr:site-2 protease family protein [Anaerolineae bacterium]
MLNETASSRDDRPLVRRPEPEQDPEESLNHAIRLATAEVMEIESSGMEGAQSLSSSETMIYGGQPTARFVGQLRLDSEAAYEKLDTQFRKLDHTLLLREEKGKHVILAMPGRIQRRPRPWWPNLLLFIATLGSVLLVGTGLAIQEIAVDNLFQAQRISENLITNLWRGLPYALSIMLILGAHELGHYFAARRHNLDVTLPYFIPLPIISPFGTLGAFIQLREPMRNRKMLLDVGAAGPLTGLIFAIPILFIGLASARTGPVMPGGVYEGDSLIYAFAKIYTFGQFLPSNGIDVYINSSQLAWAGWTGLLVSALNLIPIGQLDGGHILYSLIGDRARWLYFPLLVVMIGLVFVTQVWLLWVILLLLFGRVYATPLDTVTPLDNRRRFIAILSLVMFVLIFVPMPLTETSGAPVPRSPAETNVLLEQAGALLMSIIGR